MKIVLSVFCVVLLQLLVSDGDAYRILGVFPAPAYSHYNLGSRLMKGLAENGHEVTLIAPFKDKNPPKRFREIVLKDIADKAEG